MIRLMKLCGLVGWSHEESVLSEYKPHFSSSETFVRSVKPLSTTVKSISVRNSDSAGSEKLAS